LQGSLSVGSRIALTAAQSKALEELILMFRSIFKARMVLALCAVFFAFSMTAMADLVNLVDIATGFNAPIGVDYHSPTNSLILSANYPSGNPHNFELVDTNGVHTQFSTVSGLGDEIYMAAVRATANGFIAGQTYTGNGVAGQILKMSPDGTTVTNDWVTLPGETGLLRGALHIDTTGVFGGNLIVGTTAGGLWEVTAAGVATKIGQAPTNIEGIVTIPNDPGKYGAWAGKILTGSDGANLYLFDGISMSPTIINMGFNSTENLNIPLAGEAFYGVDFANGKLKGGDASQFTSYVGDVIMGEENGNLWDIKWNGTSFVKTLLTHVGQFEGATFARAALPGLAPEPSALVLLCTAIGGVAILQRRRRK
jgi:hypothetical protein